jgi:ankyrin repeat protein
MAETGQGSPTGARPDASITYPEDSGDLDSSVQLIGMSSKNPEKQDFIDMDMSGGSDGSEEVGRNLRAVAVEDFIQRLSLLQSISYGVDVFRSVLERHLKMPGLAGKASGASGTTLADILENGRSRFYPGDPLIFHVVRMPLRKNSSFRESIGSRRSSSSSSSSSLCGLCGYAPGASCSPGSTRAKCLCVQFAEAPLDLGKTTADLFPEESASDRLGVFLYLLEQKELNVNSRDCNDQTLLSTLLANGPFIPEYCCRDYSKAIEELSQSLESFSLTATISASPIYKPGSTSSQAYHKDCGCFDRLLMLAELLRHPSICASGPSAAVSLPSFRFLPLPAYSSSASLSLSSKKVSVQPIELACMAHYFQAAELLLAHPQLTRINLNAPSQLPLLLVPLSESVKGKSLIELVLDYSDIVHGEMTSYHGLSVVFEQQPQIQLSLQSHQGNFSPLHKKPSSAHDYSPPKPRKQTTFDDEAESVHALLMQSLFKDDVDLVLLLLDHGCDVSCLRTHPLQVSCYSVLHMAVSSGNHFVVNVLLEHDSKLKKTSMSRQEVADTNSFRRTSTMNSEGSNESQHAANAGKLPKIVRSPVELACSHVGDHYKVVSALIEHGAALYSDSRSKSSSSVPVPNRQDHATQSFSGSYAHDFNCLTISAEAGNVKIVQFIIQFMGLEGSSGAASRASLGEEALVSACKYGHLEVVKVLVQNGFGYPVNEVKLRGGISLLYVSLPHILLVKYLLTEAGCLIRPVRVPFYSAYHEFYHCANSGAFDYRMLPLLHITVLLSLFPVVNIFLFSAKDLDLNMLDVYNRLAVGYLGSAAATVGATRYSSLSMWEEELALLPLLLTTSNSAHRDGEGNTVLMDLLLRDRQWMRRCPQLAEATFPSELRSSSLKEPPMLITTLRLVNAYLDIIEQYDYSDGAAALVSYGPEGCPCIRSAFDIITDQWFSITNQYPASYLSDNIAAGEGTKSSGRMQSSGQGVGRGVSQQPESAWANSSQSSISGITTLREAIALKTQVLHRLSALARKHRVAIALALTTGNKHSHAMTPNSQSASIPLAFRKCLAAPVIGSKQQPQIPPLGKDTGRIMIPEEEIWCRDDVRIRSIDTDDDVDSAVAVTVGDRRRSGSLGSDAQSLAAKILPSIVNTTANLVSMWQASRSTPQPQIVTMPLPGNITESTATDYGNLTEPGTPAPKRLPTAGSAGSSNAAAIPIPSTPIPGTPVPSRTTSVSGGSRAPVDITPPRTRLLQVEYFDSGREEIHEDGSNISPTEQKVSNVGAEPPVHVPLIPYPSVGFGLVGAMIGNTGHNTQLNGVHASSSVLDSSTEPDFTAANPFGPPASSLFVRPTIEGTLLRKSDWLREWRPRYVLLYGSRLYICNHPAEPPKLEVDLSKRAGSNLQLHIEYCPNELAAHGDLIPELRISGIKGRPLGLHFRSTWLGTRDSEIQSAHICDLMRWMQALSEVP